MYTYSDFEKVGIGLERWHGLFNRFWAMGQPRFTDKIPTAAVAFNKKGQFVEFLFNEQFWKSLNPTEKEFVIAHEILHCLLEHGKRAINCDEQQIANIAMDIVVNHSLVDNFKFDPNDMPDLTDKIIWKDKVFGKKASKIENNREFEYYYSKIMTECPLVKIPTLDVHGYGSGGEGQLPEGSEPIPDHIMDTIKDRIEDALNEEEFKSGIKAGAIAGTGKKKVKRQQKRVLQRWEKIINKWTCKDQFEDEIWTRKARRMTFMPDEFILPWDGVADSTKGKANVLFFQDTSGSCVDFADHFFNAARTFPENYFNVRAFCFDTKIYPVDYKNPTLKGFGGTRFDIIEEYINKHIKSYDAVFIFTDGAGNNVQPRFPKKYHVFLEGDWTSKNCFPKDVHFYNLKDFVS